MMILSKSPRAGARLRRTAAGTALAAALASAGPAAATDVQRGITPLPDLGGLTRAQTSMAISIDAVCPQLTAQSPLFNGPGLTRPEADLTGVCTGMAAAAAVVLGEDAQATQDFIAALNSLAEEQEAEIRVDFATLEALAYNLPADKINGAIQQINAEEFQTGQSAILEVRASAMAAVGARMAALRAGTTGFAFTAPPIAVAGSERDPRLAALPLDAAALATGEAARAAQGGGNDAFLGRIGGFVSIGASWGSKDASDAADAFDFTAPGLTLGADYRVTDNAVLGLALTYDQIDYDFVSSVNTANTAAGQEIDTDSFLVTAFGTVSVTDELFLEATVSGGFAKNDSTRRIVLPYMGTRETPDVDRDAVADYGSRQYGATLGAGYDIALGPATITPLAQFEYVHGRIDGARETGADGLDLVISGSHIDSLTSQLGVEAAVPISTGAGIVRPYLRGEWIHEFLGGNSGPFVRYANDGVVGNVSVVKILTEDVDNTYGRLTGGVTMTLPNGIVGFVEGSTVLGLENYDVYTVTGGLRITF